MYKKNEEEENLIIYEPSMVIQTIDNPPKAAFKSIVISIFDNIVNIINKLIVMNYLCQLIE